MSAPTVTPPKTLNISTQKVDTQAEYQALIDGIQTLLPGMDPFALAKRTITRAALLAEFERRIEAAKRTKADRISLAASVASEREIDAAVRPLRSAFKPFAQGHYGKSAAELQQLGFVQNRRPRKSAQKKAAGVVKAQATRKARGTKGRQQEALATSPAALAPAAQSAASPSPVATPAANPAAAAPPKAGS
jgi:hypothetical protein